jgi:hypothetical protein
VGSGSSETECPVYLKRPHPRPGSGTRADGIAAARRGQKGKFRETVGWSDRIWGMSKGPLDLG